MSDSLSEIIDDDWVFNTSGRNDNATRIESLKSNLQRAKQDVVTSVSGSQKHIEATKNVEVYTSELMPLLNLQKVNSGKSLFNKNALLDYGRFDTNTIWVDNKPTTTAKGESRVYTTNDSKGGPLDTSNGAVQEKNELTVSELIKWSERYPALQLRYQDFVFCKNLGVFPNNRLVVLRRFRNGVPDNLFNFLQSNDEKIQEYAQPISTMITWWKPDTPFMIVGFKEVWDRNEKGDFFENLANKGNVKEEKIIDFSLFNLTENSMLFALLEGLGESADGVGNFVNEPGGNPNLIRNAAIRKTGGSGISSNIEFTLDFDFEMRLIRNIDPGIVMLDLISNCFRMGTSTSQFRMDYALLKDKSIQLILNGQYDEKLNTLFSSLTAKGKELTKQFTTLVNNTAADFKEKGAKQATLDIAGEVIKGGAKHIISRYREKIKHALAAETGLPSGKWHVTIGNPKAPIVSCGDMVITSSTLTLGKELGFNDFPNSFRYTIALSTARDRGRNELEKIFNAGRGRVYVYQQPAENPDYSLEEPSKNKTK